MMVGVVLFGVLFWLLGYAAGSERRLKDDDEQEPAARISFITWLITGLWCLLLCALIIVRFGGFG